ncbi:MAG: hypothetical protein ACE5GI_04355 [Candidatus Aminicenantales bacterium]
MGPIPNSLLFLRRNQDFSRVALHSDYFNPEDKFHPNPGLKSPPSTRPLSALSLVTSLRYQGMKKVIKRLQASLSAVRIAAKYLKNSADMELCHQPQTSILCFRTTPPHVPKDQWNNLQQYIYDRILEEGKRTISITKLDEKIVLRLVAVSSSVTGQSLIETISYVRSLAKQHAL